MGELEIIAIYLLIGLAAGLSGGMLGLGGGFIVVPCLYGLFLYQGFAAEHLMQLAVATSLGTILFTGSASAWSHHRRNSVCWRKVVLLSPGILCGGLLGAQLASWLSSTMLRRFYGFFALFTAAQILFPTRPRPAGGASGRAGLLGVGVGIGAFSALLGIGGGTLTVPFLLWQGEDMRRAVGTAAACGVPVAAAGAVGMIWAGWDRPGLPPLSLGYLYLPAVLGIALAAVPSAYCGARLAHRLSVRTLRFLFAILLIVVGFLMLLGG